MSSNSCWMGNSSHAYHQLRGSSPDCPGSEDELERVDELESVHSNGEILLHVLWNYPHLSNEFTLQRFDNQVPIIALEVIHDYRGSFHSDFDILYAGLYLLCAQCDNDNALCPLPTAGFICDS